MKRSRGAGDRSVSPPASKKKIESSTTGKVVANFFKKASEKEPDKLQWRIIHNSLLVGRYEVKGSSQQNSLPAPKRRKIAAFDFDSTLIKTSSGNVFGKTAEDWQWWHGSVPRKLRELHDQDYQIIIISNQAGIKLNPKEKKVTDKDRLTVFKMKVGYILSQVDLPISIYAATAKDGYRKPRTGMWTQLMQDYGFNDEHSVDLGSSLFVGDAAGRQEGPNGVKKDHSCSDRDFAANVGIKFHTPEEFFLDEPPRPFQRSFDFSGYIPEKTSNAIDEQVISKKYDIELIVLCGSPGAGKSTFYAKHLQPLGYERVNQDILKTRDKCIKVAAQYLTAKHSVVVDNTNADIDTRSYWIELAKKHSVPIRAIHLTTPAALCRHNDAVRAAYDSKNPTKSALLSRADPEDVAEDLSLHFNPEHRIVLPEMAFSGYQSRYIEPSIDEGFDEVIKVPFTFEGTAQAKAVWSRYWI